MKKILALLLALALLCGVLCSCQGSKESALFSSIEHSGDTLRYSGVDFLITEEEFLKALPEAKDYAFQSGKDQIWYTKTVSDNSLDMEVKIDFKFYYGILCRIDMTAESSYQKDEAELSKQVAALLKKQLPEVYTEISKDAQNGVATKLEVDGIGIKVDDTLLQINTHSSKEFNESAVWVELYSLTGNSFSPSSPSGKQRAEEFLANRK